MCLGVGEELDLDHQDLQQDNWYHSYTYAAAAGEGGEMGEHSSSATWLYLEGGGEEPGLWFD